LRSSQDFGEALGRKVGVTAIKSGPTSGATPTKITAGDTGKVWRLAATTAIPAASINRPNTEHINRGMRSSAEDGELATTRAFKGAHRLFTENSSRVVTTVEVTGKVGRPAAMTAVPVENINRRNTKHTNRAMKSSVEAGEFVTTRVSKVGKP
jgi:hypothetical protein